NPSLAPSPWFNFQLDLARSLVTVFPGALLWGASFPLAIAAVAERGSDPARLVGRVYAANTLGAILGALGFSMLLVPWIGTGGAAGHATPAHARPPRRADAFRPEERARRRVRRGRDGRRHRAAPRDAAHGDLRDGAAHPEGGLAVLQGRELRHRARPARDHHLR